MLGYYFSKQAIALLNAVWATDESNLLHSRTISLEIGRTHQDFSLPPPHTNFLAIFAFPISKVDEE